MKPSPPPLRRAALYCADCVVLLACWLLWLALGALLAFQIAITVSHEFALPGWMLRTLEGRFAASGVHAQFGRATFNPTGGVLLENLTLSLPEFEKPVILARAVYLDLDPWLLLSGQVEAHRVHATGLKLFAPGMLTPSGHDEEIVRDLEFTLVPGDNIFTLEHLAARVAGVAVTAHGAVQFQRTHTAGAIEPLPLVAALAGHFAAFAQQLRAAGARLAPLDDPQLDLALVPSTTRGAIARVTLTARQLALPAFHDLAVRELRATATLPLLGDAPTLAPLTLLADEVQLGSLATAHRLRVSLRGALSPGKLTYTPRRLELTAADAAARGFTVSALAATVLPSSALRSPSSDLRPPSSDLRPPISVPTALDATLLAFLSAQPIAVAAHADTAAQTATLHVTGRAAPALLTPIGEIIHHEIRRFFDYAAPIDLDVVATFGAGWKFQNVAGRVDLRQIDAYRVPIDAAHGEIEFDGRHFLARRAFAALGENFARGSFEQDLKTKAYRFLLEGRLRPLAIGGWFHGSWWPNIFSSFSFPDSPPAASVDVAGRWFAPETTTVFVFAETVRPVIRGATFDSARTLLFIRPNFIDGLEAFGTRGAGELRGKFAYYLADGSWSRLAFDFDSSIELDPIARLLGPALAARLTPFTFEQPPPVHATGVFTAPTAPGGAHQELHLSARTTGAFTFQRFPGRNLAFDAVLRDDVLTLENLRAEAAGGTLTGRARVWGPDDARRLGFDGAVQGAKLQQAVTLVTEYAALRQQRAANSAEKILAGNNEARLDLALSAEGRLDDPYSFTGSGNASLAGELGQVRLLGLLSELLNFTALRFTAARTEFKIQGRKVVFPAVSITGANSAIEAHGDYLLDRHELNFNARVYPFQESKSLLSVVGVVLTPFSAVLEVKLTGPLDQPKWAFVIGPTNFLRSLGGSSTPEPTPPAAPAPAAPSPATLPPNSPPPPKETH